MSAPFDDLTKSLAGSTSRRYAGASPGALCQRDIECCAGTCANKDPNGGIGACS
jgi:hypothetical protein